MVSKQQFKYIVDKSTNCELSESLTQHTVYDKSTDASRKQYHENSLMLHHPPFKQSHCSTCCFCRDQHGQQGQKLLCWGTHTDWQFAIHFVSATSRQNQTTSFTSWTAEKHPAYLPPALSVVVCWGRVAAVPGPQGDGLQKRRKRCCPVFLIAPLQGHWVVLQEQEQNTVCDKNTKLELKNSSTRSLPCNVFNIFSTSDLHVCHTQAKTKCIFTHLNFHLKILGGAGRGGRIFHPSLGHSDFILLRNLTHLWGKTLHDSIFFQQLQVLTLHTHTLKTCHIWTQHALTYFFLSGGKAKGCMELSKWISILLWNTWTRPQSVLLLVK